MSAYTLNGAAARVAAIEEAAWLTSTALCVMMRMRGATKKLAEAKVFGQEKPTATFQWAWRQSEIVFSTAFTDTAKATIGTLGLDDAAKMAVNAIRSHMTLLGVNGKNAYREVGHFASLEEKQAAEALAKADADEAAALAKAEADAAAEAAAGAADEAEAEREEELAAAKAAAADRDLVAEAAAIMDLMSVDDLNKLAILLTERLTENAMKQAA